jgi:hypothetical protein
MDVCDVDGNKFGSVARVYRHEMVAAAATSSSSNVGTMPPDEILEIKTGLFGLGKHLYVPFSAIQDVTSGCVFLNQPKDGIENQAWDTKPDYLDDLS